MTFNQDWKKTKFKELSPTWMEGPFYQVLLTSSCTTHEIEGKLTLGLTPTSKGPKLDWSIERPDDLKLPLKQCSEETTTLGREEMTSEIACPRC